MPEKIPYKLKPAYNLIDCYYSVTILIIIWLKVKKNVRKLCYT